MRAILHTKQEIADKLGLDRAQLIRWIDEGTIPELLAGKRGAWSINRAWFRDARAGIALRRQRSRRAA